ncbi:MAG: hypothetical protein MUC59_13495 [Saprospiraceae bacterium]|jgi:hypothetical protein|nr:hypothetical protein [Saprospiraceae bacterium]
MREINPLSTVINLLVWNVRQILPHPVGHIPQFSGFASQMPPALLLLHHEAMLMFYGLLYRRSAVA